MLTLTISEADTQKLNYERFRIPSPVLQKRLHVLYLKATTRHTHQMIAHIADVHPDTVTDYIRCFNKDGWAGITQLHYRRNESELTAHKALLMDTFSTTPPHTINQAIEQIEQLTGLRRNPTQVRHWLLQQGFKWRKMGVVPAKADPAKQTAFLKETLEPLIEKAANQQLCLLFMDAAHFVMGAFLCQVWSLVRLFLPTPSGRQRLNVLGAVDAITRQIHLLTNQTYITSTTIVAFLEQLRQAYGPQKAIWLVLDNARYQRCQLVQQAALRFGIELVFLPAYSPNLNLIERLWKWTKKRCLYGRYHASFADFQTSIISCLEQANTQHQSELTRLLSLKFQQF